MSANYVTSMWGSCDGTPIVFTAVKAPTIWKCDVPADLDDGTYYVEIYGRCVTGGLIYTNAVLHIVNSSVVKFEIIDSDYIFYVMEDKI